MIDPMGEDRDDDFYEEDEPLQAIVAAFEKGDQGTTAPQGMTI